MGTTALVELKGCLLITWSHEGVYFLEDLRGGGGSLASETHQPLGFLDIEC